MKIKREVAIGGGFSLESGEMARQANGACVVRAGGTVVLTTACVAGDFTAPRPFLPLTVEYREASAAAGRIPGGFFKREGRPSEKEIISCRITDRPLRPLFPKGYTAETQVISMVLSADGENDPDVLAINGASAALVLSEIPFYHPVGAVRVGLIDGDLVFNPTSGERDVSELDLIVVGTEEAIVMVEAGANQLAEPVVLDAVFRAHQELQKSIRAQHELFRETGLAKPVWEEPEAYSEELFREVSGALRSGLRSALFTKEKGARRQAVAAVVDGYLAGLGGGDIAEEDPDKLAQIRKVLGVLEGEILAEAVLGDGRRFDDRALDEIRPISIETGVLPRTHGSALFTRGETQALVSATLGTRRDAQIIEEYEGETLQKFLLHYNFPPFSVGEVKFLRGPGRREIGHGVLARRALMPVLPHEDDFPYTIRLVSDILESNGSSSMASVCGGSLALFDVGVPMLSAVAGVAMGLIKRGERFAVLSDIAGQEDHHGDMDFKVAGTREGITALQMDIKITGVSREIMAQALEQARRGRLEILDKMDAALAQPRPEISLLAPRLFTMQVSRDKIREIIGPGGKTIRSIQEETGCEVEIEPDGKIIIASPDGTAARRAMEIIEKLTEVPEVGKVYQGVVTRIESFGAFVEILPGTEGLLHVSELAPFRVREVSDILREGDQVEVKALEVDPDGRRIRLSRKAVVLDDPSYDPATDPFAAAAESSEGRPDRGERGPGERGGDRGERGGERGGRGGRGPGGRPPAGRGGRGGGGGGRGRGRPPGRDR
ncbi:MAG TPA: polyribonucleotide nucleotidyltransferase [Thermoanaerobaculia bacterium]|jgi:polyribonucleotide nucleotidyltransferase